MKKSDVNDNFENCLKNNIDIFTNKGSYQFFGYDLNNNLIIYKLSKKKMDNDEYNYIQYLLKSKDIISCKTNFRND